MTDWTWLSIQAFLTIIAAEQLRRRVFVALGDIQQPQLVLDVWAPLILVLPMMFVVRHIDHDVRGAGWMIIGGPVLCGVLAVGSALTVGVRTRREPMESRAWSRVAIIGICAGVLLLLICATHELTIWIGQCAFAIGALLLWLNTPDLPEAADSGNGQSRIEKRVGSGLTAAILSAIGQGIAAANVSSSFSGLSGAMMIAGGAITLAAATAIAGCNAGVRIGLWAASLGVLLGLGIIALERLSPVAIELFSTLEPQPVIHRVAWGFAAYAPEATLLVATSAMAFVLPRLSMRWSRPIGVVVIVAAAALAAWRLAD